jgi:glutathione S-transferase
MTQPQLILHGSELSGHSHRVELLLLMLELPYRFVPATAEIRRGVEFRRLNPLGQVPVLEDGALVLADSNAILVYLAKRYAPDSWLPEEPVAASQVQRWLSIAAGELKNGPGTARLIALWGADGDATRAASAAASLLTFMEGHLADRDWLATAHPTIADLACYSYTAHAPEGGIPLAAYPAVRAWLRRVEALPRFRAMPPSVTPHHE